MRVLSPVGVTKYVESKDELARRPERLEGKVVGILDDGAGKDYTERIKELLLEQCKPANIIHRVKPLLSAPAPLELLNEFARVCDVVIVGTGIWGSCTSGCMHDSVRLEKKGIPSICMVHDRFEKAAKAQALVMGLPSAKIIVIPEGSPDELPQQRREKIDKLWGNIAGGLANQ